MANNSFTNAFPDHGGAIAGAFFASTDVTEKTWGSAKLLAEADNVAFWTVFAHHRSLPSVMANLINAADTARSSTSSARRKTVSKEYESSLCTIVMRVATTSGLCTSEKGANPADLARRIDAVFPLSILFPISTMLFRRSGAAASITVSSLFLLNPSYLCRLQLHLADWFDNINRITSRCTTEMACGRYQRMTGDIIPLFEQTYRTTKHLWAMLQSAPFTADYIPLSRCIRTLRVIVDVIAPVLQHFLISCDGLRTRRDVLSKANAMIINTSVNSSTMLILFHTFNRPGHDRAWVIPSVTSDTYEALGAFISQYCSGTPQVLVDSLGGGRTIQSLLHQLSPPLEDVDDGQIGKVLLALFQPIADSRDFADLLLEARDRFGEVILLELVQQGLAIDALLSGRYVTAFEAQKLGASENSIVRAMAGLPVEDPGESTESGGAPASSSPSRPPVVVSAEDSATAGDPLVDMVADIFPHYSRHGIRAALNYYNNDPEQFILDASMDNIPPHLASQLTPALPTGSGAAEASVSADAGGAVVAAPKKRHLTGGDFEDDLKAADLHLYLGSDLYELLAGSDREDDADPKDDSAGQHMHDFVTYRKDEPGGGDLAGDSRGFGNVDDELREKIRMLNEMMYEDELDDGRLNEVHVANAGTDTDTENEGDAGEYRRNAKGPIAGSGAKYRKPDAAPRRQPRSQAVAGEDAEGRLPRDQRAGRAGGGGGTAGTAPSYAAKQKTAKRKQATGSEKNSLMRAVKKGMI